MPSSTSSSDPRRWGIAWIVAVAVALAIGAGWERHWRSQGLHPGLIDSADAWARQRDRVYSSDRRPVVFLGASRTVYGIDPRLWTRHCPQDKPLMLAVNGHYPVAALRDLADDPGFSGLVVVDIDSYGLLTAHHGMQERWVIHYHRRWNANWRVHRLLLDLWQRHSVLSNPGIGLIPTLRRALGSGSFTLPYSESRSDRSGWMRFDRVEVAALAAALDAGIDRKIARFPAPSPEDFLQQASAVQPMVERIRKRGGEVVFVVLPVAGRQVEMESRYMPRSDYWDRFAALPGIRALHYEDVPGWRGLPLPDHSHVARDHRDELTLGLMQTLADRGWLQEATDQ